MKSLVFWGVAPAVLAAVCGSTVSASADIVRVVAKVGDTVTLDGASGTIADFNLGSGTVMPIVSASGHVSFTATVRGTGITTTNGQTIWLSPPATSAQPNPAPRLVMRTQSAAPNLNNPLIKFTAISSPQLSDQGDVLFSGTITGPTITAGVNNYGYWKFGASAYDLLAREGADVPDQLSTVLDISAIGDVQFPKRDQRGMMAFRSNLVGSGVNYGNDKVAWLSDGSLHLVAREGNPVANLSNVFFGQVQMVVSDAGFANAYANLTGSGVRVRGSSGTAGPSDQAIWRVTAPMAFEADCTLALVARAGNPAPNSSGRNFHSLYATNTKPQMNSSGSLAFAALLSDANGVGYDSGIWTNMGGSLRAIAISRESATEAGTGVTFGSMFTPFTGQHVFACDSRGNGSGKVVAITPLSGTGVWSGNDRAVMSYDASTNTRRMILRGGDVLPGARDGATIVNGSISTSIRVNRYGDVLANLQVAGPNITAYNDRAIVVQVGDTVRTLAREGDAVPGATGLTIYEITSTTSTWFNNRGQVVFGASVIDAAGGTPKGALLRADEFGNLRLMALVNGTVDGQTGQSLRYGAPVVGSAGSFGDNGHFVFISDLQVGSSSVGRSVVSVQIEPGSTIAPPPPPPCPADFNGNGVVSEQDLFDFFAAYFSGNGDFDRDGQTALHDLYMFIGVWSSGC